MVDILDLIRTQRNPFVQWQMQQESQPAEPVNITDASGADNADWLTQLEQSPQYVPHSAPVRSSPVMQMASRSQRRSPVSEPEPEPQYEPTTGSEMEADQSSSIDKIIARMQASREADRQSDRNAQWMSFFSALAGSKNPRLMGGLGEGAQALNETTGKQSQANKLLERAALEDELKLEQWKQEQALKKAQAGPENALKEAQAGYYRSGGSGAAGAGMGGATGVLAQRLMEEKAAQGTPITFAEALYAVQTGMRQGTNMKDGAVSPIPGVLDVLSAEEKAKIEGKGEITPKETSARGKNQVSIAVNDIRDTYTKLNEAGGAVNKDNSIPKNIAAYAGNSAIGQTAGRMMGTGEQELRDKIKNTRPLLINSIRQATNMSAKAMDSNAELQFYLQMATDPQAGFPANISALNQIDKLYGTNVGDNSADSPVPKPARKYNPATGKIE